MMAYLFKYDNQSRLFRGTVSRIPSFMRAEVDINTVCKAACRPDLLLRCLEGFQIKQLRFKPDNLCLLLCIPVLQL